jgi:methionyl-tRNA synthetase
VAQPGFIAPASRRKEVENFVASGLKDFSISRVGLPWGIPVPGRQGHTFYVWFDALLGYLSALLDPAEPVDLNRLSERGWPAGLHVIGKDILRFHAVFWPAMLLSAGLELPGRVFGHGFLTREGQKMGKSLGNVLDPELLLERCGSDAVRWYLLRDIPFGEDGDFQQQRFQDLVNNDLANTIGNLLNRTSSMARKWFGGAVPPAGAALDSDHDLARRCQATLQIHGEAFERFDFRTAAEAVLQLAIDANGFLNERAPWKRMKEAGQETVVASDLYAVLETCRWLGLLLAPLLPDLSGRLLDQLAEPACASGSATAAVGETPGDSWSRALTWGALASAQPLPEPSPVMQRLELDGPL